MEKAKAYYLKGYKRFDPYTQPINKIFWLILKENCDGKIKSLLIIMEWKKLYVSQSPRELNVAKKMARKIL